MTLDPFGDPIERALRLGELVVGVERTRGEVLGLGQRQRQHLVGQHVRVARRVVDDRDRLTPVALPGEQPVTQLVGDRRLAGAYRLQPLVDRGDALVDRGDAVERHPAVRRVDVWRVTDERLGPVAGIERRLEVMGHEPFVGWPLDRRDVEPVDGRELEVALVAAGHRHDRSGAVAHQHVVGDPNRDVLAGGRVGRVRSGEHARLGTLLVEPLGLLERRRGLAVLDHLGGLL